MSSSNRPTYVPSYLSLLRAWSSYKHSSLSLLPSNLEQDLEVFRNLVLQSQNSNALPDNREAGQRLAEEFQKHRKKELEDLVAQVDEMAEQMLSALEKAETEITSLRPDLTQPVQPFRPSFDSYPNRRTLRRRQADGTYASMTEEEEKGYKEERATKRAAAQERWEMGERQSKDQRDRRRKERDRRREERKRGEERPEEHGKGDGGKESTQKTGGGENEAGETDEKKREK